MNHGCAANRVMDGGERPAAERVRTVLARGAGGTVEAGLLRRPVRSGRVRDDGVVVLVVDVGVDGADVTTPGASASVEIVDTVCTGRCRSPGSRPSFAVDGRADTMGTCGEDCAVARGIITLSGIVIAGSPSRRRRLVATEGGTATAGEAGVLRLGELRPLEVSYLAPDGAHVVRATDLAAAPVDPVGVDEQAWLRRFAADPGMAARVAARLTARAGRPDGDVDVAESAPVDPWIVGIDRRGLDLVIRGGHDGAREIVRVPFAQVCSTAEDVNREVDALAG